MLLNHRRLKLLTDTIPVKPGSRRGTLQLKFRAPSTEESESSPIETQSLKPKLELPKPPWETPLVYPPNGPRKEVIDYDDLKRLNSNSYLNDNIINFYLKYIEVQLGHKNPEVAKETYFLNTFFYERLTKRDDKK
ncbi:hypothetical protein P167DRAFT_156606 [Morchella conica CCBAS932]|uniref:Ubiquitin-like protease family profile domain-containing protein n=1 Tax=Morchella conica CCBAS932 TaxID=1392247 RepID=A0A3N4L361_9PEZI|nr:hypothetical protein P167DRAFT_156606 [Morchella conica CCBAS932]